MKKMNMRIRTRVSIFIASAVAQLAFGCSGAAERAAPEYRPGPDLAEWEDPLRGERPLRAWNPPEQFACYIFPHVDPDQDVAIGGHWILLKLTEGSWYFEGPGEREIVPDGETGEDDLDAARESLGDFAEVVVPYRPVQADRYAP